MLKLLVFTENGVLALDSVERIRVATDGFSLLVLVFGRFQKTSIGLFVLETTGTLFPLGFELSAL